MSRFDANGEPTDQQLNSSAEIRDIFSTAEAQLSLHVKPSRLQSIMLTHLETACMYAVKAVMHPEVPRG